MHNTELQFSQYQTHRQHFWDEVNSRKTYSLGTHYHQRVTSTYQNLVPTGSRVLEIGCAEGKLLHSLKPSYGLGIDFSSQAIENAKKKYPTLDFIKLDAHAIDLGTQKFDFIILSELVNDVWDVQAILESHSENAIDLQVAIQLAVVARFYERIGDHAVNIGERVRYLVTGWLPEHKGAARFRQKSGEDDTDGIPFFPNKES
jgi:hypothetical protein